MREPGREAGGKGAGTGGSRKGPERRWRILGTESLGQGREGVMREAESHPVAPTWFALYPKSHEKPMKGL